jgi:hypothetical protein
MTPAAIAVLVAIAVVLPATAQAATKAQEASQQVCFAAADINNWATGLPNDTIAPGTPADAKLTLQQIRIDLAKIAAAQAALPPANRALVLAATRAFTIGIVRLAPALLGAPTGPAPALQRTRFTTAAALAPVLYKRTLGLIPC